MVPILFLVAASQLVLANGPTDPSACASIRAAHRVTYREALRETHDLNRELVRSFEPTARLLRSAHRRLFQELSEADERIRTLPSSERELAETLRADLERRIAPDLRAITQSCSRVLSREVLSDWSVEITERQCSPVVLLARAGSGLVNPLRLTVTVHRRVESALGRLLQRTSLQKVSIDLLSPEPVLPDPWESEIELARWLRDFAEVTVNRRVELDFIQCARPETISCRISRDELRLARNILERHSVRLNRALELRRLLQTPPVAYLESLLTPEQREICGLEPRSPDQAHASERDRPLAEDLDGAAPQALGSGAGPARD